MYGSGAYGQIIYGSEEAGEATGPPLGLELSPPLLLSPFSLYPPAIVSDTLTLTLSPPLLSIPFTLYAPESAIADSVTMRGRPLAEDIRIMRVRRSNE